MLSSILKMLIPIVGGGLFIFLLIAGTMDVFFDIPLISVKKYLQYSLMVGWLTLFTVVFDIFKKKQK